MATTLDLDLLMQAVGLTALLAGFLGALVWSASGALVRLVWVLVHRALNRRRVARSVALSRASLGYPRSRGFVDPLAAVVVVLVTLLALSACSDGPPPLADDHATWLEWVKSHEIGYIK